MEPHTEVKRIFWHALRKSQRNNSCRAATTLRCRQVAVDHYSARNFQTPQVARLHRIPIRVSGKGVHKREASSHRSGSAVELRIGRLNSELRSAARTWSIPATTVPPHSSTPRASLLY